MFDILCVTDLPPGMQNQVIELLPPVVKNYYSARKGYEVERDFITGNHIFLDLAVHDAFPEAAQLDTAEIRQGGRKGVTAFYDAVATKLQNVDSTFAFQIQHYNSLVHAGLPTGGGRISFADFIKQDALDNILWIVQQDLDKYLEGPIHREDPEETRRDFQSRLRRAHESIMKDYDAYKQKFDNLCLYEDACYLARSHHCHVGIADPEVERDLLVLYNAFKKHFEKIEETLSRSTTQATKKPKCKLEVKSKFSVRNFEIEPGVKIDMPTFNITYDNTRDALVALVGVRVKKIGKYSDEVYRTSVACEMLRVSETGATVSLVYHDNNDDNAGKNARAMVAFMRAIVRDSGHVVNLRLFQITRACMYCDRDLTSEKSIKDGVGPICKKQAAPLDELIIDIKANSNVGAIKDCIDDTEDFRDTIAQLLKSEFRNNELYAAVSRYPSVAALDDETEEKKLKILEIIARLTDMEGGGEAAERACRDLSRTLKSAEVARRTMEAGIPKAVEKLMGCAIWMPPTAERIHNLISLSEHVDCAPLHHWLARWFASQRLGRDGTPVSVRIASSSKKRARS